MLAMRNREPRIAAAICTFSITVREMACHCRETVELVALFLSLLFSLSREQIRRIRTDYNYYCYYPETWILIHYGTLKFYFWHIIGGHSRGWMLCLNCSTEQSRIPSNLKEICVLANQPIVSPPS